MFPEAAPMRCVHLNRLGRQCPAEALPEDMFCAAHSPDRELESPEPDERRPGIYRLVALLMLLIFLFNAYQTVLGWMGW